jgi:hypothetical protein
MAPKVDAASVAWPACWSAWFGGTATVVAWALGACSEPGAKYLRQLMSAEEGGFLEVGERPARVGAKSRRVCVVKQARNNPTAVRVGPGNLSAYPIVPHAIPRNRHHEVSTVARRGLNQVTVTLGSSRPSIVEKVRIAEVRNHRREDNVVSHSGVIQAGMANEEPTGEDATCVRVNSLDYRWVEIRMFQVQSLDRVTPHVDTIHVAG